MGHMMATGRQGLSERGQGADPQDPSRRSGMGITGAATSTQTLAEPSRHCGVHRGILFLNIEVNRMYNKTLVDVVVLTLPER